MTLSDLERRPTPTFKRMRTEHFDTHAVSPYTYRVCKNVHTKLNSELVVFLLYTQNKNG